MRRTDRGHPREDRRADPLDIQSTSSARSAVGAATRGPDRHHPFWFEQGSLDNEKKVADNLKYQVENRTIAGVQSIVMKPNDGKGACGVASDAGGVVGWWVNPQQPGIDACSMAIKLMELTLAPTRSVR